MPRAATHSPVSTEQEVAGRQLAAALARIAGGDRNALKLVYRDTAAKLFGVCLRILHDRGEAEDVLQEVYLTVWRRAAAFDPRKASAASWLVAIARNRSIDRVRSGVYARRMQSTDGALDIADDAPGALEQVETAEEHQRLNNCLEELEPKDASAIRAAFLDGATYEMLAEQMKVPLGTMKSRIRRSLIKLRACLER